MKIHTIQFEHKKGKPLYLQLYEKIQGDIISGYVKKGDQLPSIRKCVSELHVSKTVVEHAYERLLDEGFIVSLDKKGFFVDVDAQNANLRKQVMERPLPIPKQVMRYDFRSQTMDNDAFDVSLWKKYIKSVLDTHDEIATYGNPQGEYALRLSLQKYAYAMRGVLCHHDQIVVGASFQSLLYILCGLLCKPLIVGMEKGGFVQAETVFHDYGYPIRMLPHDDKGISMDALYKSDINVLYINSGSQGNLHQPIERQRIQELLLWAHKKDAIILEDDHNGELRYISKSTPAMQGSDRNQQVIYIGSFSKILLPSLRISYMVLPTFLQARYQKRNAFYAPTSSKIEQLAFAHYIADGHMQRQVKRLRKRYEVKSMTLKRLLKKYFVTKDFILEEAGLQFIMPWNEAVEIDEFIKSAKSCDIQIMKRNDNEIAFSFAAIDEDDMEHAISILYEVFNNMKEKLC